MAAAAAVAMAAVMAAVMAVAMAAVEGYQVVEGEVEVEQVVPLVALAPKAAKYSLGLSLRIA